MGALDSFSCEEVYFYLITFWKRMRMSKLKTKNRYESSLETITFLGFMHTYSQEIRYTSYSYAHMKHFLCCKVSTVYYANSSFTTFRVKHDRYGRDERQLSDTFVSIPKNIKNMKGQCLGIVRFLNSDHRPHPREISSVWKTHFYNERCFGCIEEHSTLLQIV